MTTVADTRPTAPDPARPTPEVSEPAGTAPVVLPSLLAALVLVGLGVLGVQTALVAAGAVSGPAWLDPVLSALDTGLDRSAGTLVLGVVLGLLGLWLLARSVGRRPRPDYSLGAGTHAWTGPSDVARVASLVAADVDGVVTVRARARGRSLLLRVGAVDGADVGDRVRSEVEAATEGLEPRPRVRVRVSGGAR
ncbi:Asp23/Gls24 family envelope stress response protein [Phycicoccus flavus]|uniref:DUF6286 domain-containing protein n=1 Tax=Phycicoccus flavus TaxID=2502783 RepID=UPI000FEBC6B8|nr:DUF6286 domain-containing protein [Phycicoccus flavus]NHA70134.1 hypothetical protein [Phycicoccus flavus]